MWTTFSLKDATAQLTDAVAIRLIESPVSGDISTVRTPIGLFFIRGDRAEPGASLAKQVISSFGYWNDDSGRYLDLVFFGWGKDGDVVCFDRQAFFTCRDQVQDISKWKYSGETDLLLVNFDVALNEQKQAVSGSFTFKEAIWLPVEEMVRDKKIPHLDALVHELVTMAKEAYDTSPMRANVWQMSDQIAFYRGRRILWERIKRFFLRDWAAVYDELRPFAVCDLSKPTSKRAA